MSKNAGTSSNNMAFKILHVNSVMGSVNEFKVEEKGFDEGLHWGCTPQRRPSVTYLGLGVCELILRILCGHCNSFLFSL